MNLGNWGKKITIVYTGIRIRAFLLDPDLEMRSELKIWYDPASRFVIP